MAKSRRAHSLRCAQIGQSAGQTPRNGKQRRKRHCSLSRLEFACAEISLRRTQNHCLWHEATDIDPGIAASKGDYSLETYILSTNHYQIEFFFSSRRRHTRSLRDWSSDVCSSDLRACARDEPCRRHRGGDLERP